MPPLLPGCPFIQPSFNHDLIHPPSLSTASLPVSPTAQWRFSSGSHVELRDTQLRQAPCFSPGAHFQESACVKLQCSRRCPTFKLHSCHWDCFRGFNKRGKSLCVRVSRGVCVYVHLGYTWVHVFVCMPVFVQLCVCVCAREGRAEGL